MRLLRLAGRSRLDFARNLPRPPLGNGWPLVPAGFRRPFAAIACAAGFVGAFVAAALVYGYSAAPAGEIAGAISRDRWAALAQLCAGSGSQWDARVVDGLLHLLQRGVVDRVAGEVLSKAG